MPERFSSAGRGTLLRAAPAHAQGSGRCATAEPTLGWCPKMKESVLNAVQNESPEHGRERAVLPREDRGLIAGVGVPDNLRVSAASGPQEHRNDLSKAGGEEREPVLVPGSGHRAPSGEAGDAETVLIRTPPTLETIGRLAVVRAEQALARESTEAHHAEQITAWESLYIAVEQYGAKVAPMEEP